MTIDEYMALPYTIAMERDEEGDYIVHIEELPGCIADGRTTDEALERLREVQRMWIESCLEGGIPVPEPHCEGG